MQDTIYALSSGGLPSGIAVIRVSGPATEDIAIGLLGCMLQHRIATKRSIRSRNGEVIDNGLCLYFGAPHSFTGESCLELQVHGGRATVRCLLEEIGTFEGTRPAEPGEFTRRAFENGKIDLLEAEGLADLISAETDMQRRLAAEQARGTLSTLYRSWADRLTRARAMIEAELDFADEDDVPGSVSSMVWKDIAILKSELQDHLQAAKCGEIIRDGLRIAILGRPNAGKSSLLNALAKRDVAIVTDIPGTTRDVLHVDLDISGFSVRLYDTAGVRETEDPIEQEGVRRARVTAEEADLVLLLRDVTDKEPTLALPQGVESLNIVTKIDLAPNSSSDILGISTRTGAGLSNLVSQIEHFLSTRLNVTSLAIPSRIRHVNFLNETLTQISAAIDAVDAGLDVRAEYLRLAARNLGRITGTVDVEALLDVIFSEFCIGK